MRTNEERIRAMHLRAAELENKERIRNRMSLQAVSIACSLAVVIALAFFMSGIMTPAASGIASQNMNASLFSDNGVLSYIVIGIVAFLLGVSVTVFSYHLKNKERDAAGEDSDDGDY